MQDVDRLKEIEQTKKDLLDRCYKEAEEYCRERLSGGTKANLEVVVQCQSEVKRDAASIEETCSLAPVFAEEKLLREKTNRAEFESKIALIDREIKRLENGLPSTAGARINFCNSGVYKSI